MCVCVREGHRRLSEEGVCRDLREVCVCVITEGKRGVKVCV